MIYSYGVTQQGHYHIKNNIVCQDAHALLKISDNLCFAAVADGLGSEQYTDVASKIASNAVIDYCKAHIDETTANENILTEIKKAFDFALKQVFDEAEKNNHDKTQYDTTLSFVVFRGEKIYFGQSGDSGVVVLKKSGDYFAVTKQQRDESGCVFPLCFTDKWVFGEVDEVSSVLLATDGMLDTLFPSLLFNEPVNIYVALAQFFMDNSSLGFGTNPDDVVQGKISDFIAGISESQVNDDKTIVCVVNTSVEVQRKNEDYYRIPNWPELKKKKDEEFKRLAYPHLYKEREETDKENTKLEKKDTSNEEEHK